MNLQFECFQNQILRLQTGEIKYRKRKFIGPIYNRIKDFQETKYKFASLIYTLERFGVPSFRLEKVINISNY